MNIQHARLLRLIGWIMVAGLVVLSLIQLPQAPVAVQGGDKLLHLGSYGFLSYWFYHTYHRFPLAVTVGFVLLGSGLEWSQSLTAHRHVELLDWLMNVSGVGLAWLVYSIMKIRIRSIQLK